MVNVMIMEPRPGGGNQTLPVMLLTFLLMGESSLGRSWLALRWVCHYGRSSQYTVTQVRNENCTHSKELVLYRIDVFYVIRDCS